MGLAKKLDHEATYADVLAAPEHMVAEVVEGEFFLSPRPIGQHADAETGMAADLRVLFGKRRNGGGPGGWWIVAEIELHFGKRVLVPDLAGWRRERMPQPPSGPFQTLPPDWVCEITSPSTARLDRMRKMPVYREVGVPWVWLLSPADRMLEVFRLTEAGYIAHQVLAAEDEAGRPEPFEAEAFDLREWFPPDYVVEAAVEGEGNP